MDVIAGLGLLFGGNSSNSNTEKQYVKNLRVVAPTQVIYFDDEKDVMSKIGIAVPHVIQEYYNSKKSEYYQLLIADVDTPEERVVGIKNLKTNQIINIKY